MGFSADWVVEGGDGGVEGGIGGGDVITFVGMRCALREPIVHAAAHVRVGGGWGAYAVLYVSLVHAAAHVGGGGRGGCKYVRCRVTMHLDYVCF